MFRRALESFIKIIIASKRELKGFKKKIVILFKKTIIKLIQNVKM